MCEMNESYTVPMSLIILYFNRSVGVFIFMLNVVIRVMWFMFQEEGIVSSANIAYVVRSHVKTGDAP